MKTIRTTIDDRDAKRVAKAAKEMGVSVTEYLRYLVRTAHSNAGEKTLEQFIHWAMNS